MQASPRWGGLVRKRVGKDVVADGQSMPLFRGACVFRDLFLVFCTYQMAFQSEFLILIIRFCMLGGNSNRICACQWALQELSACAARMRPREQ